MWSTLIPIFHVLLIYLQHCQVCWDGGDVVLCSGCPRSFHYECLDRDAKARSKSKMHFSCDQHQCNDCTQKTSDAGGMLFRCRWCERAFCEDCLDWEKTDILGDNLKEYELLGFPPVDQAWYVKCPRCTEDHEVSPADFALCENAAIEIDEKHVQFLEERARAAAAEEEIKEITAVPSRDESLTDATTINTSGISTPGLNSIEQSTALSTSRNGNIGSNPSSKRTIDATIMNNRKRKAAPKSFANSFELNTLGLEDSDFATVSTNQKGRSAWESLATTHPKRSKRPKA